MDLKELRSYRIQFERPYYNSSNLGMSLFDLFMTFL